MYRTWLSDPFQVNNESKIVMLKSEVIHYQLSLYLRGEVKTLQSDLKFIGDKQT